MPGINTPKLLINKPISLNTYHLDVSGNINIDGSIYIYNQPLSTSGTDGTQGTQGTLGSQGAQGTIGSQGILGSQGTQGIIGSQGTQGIIGSQGTQGIIGSQGTQGTLGSQGTQGIIGSQGTQGTLGSQGTQGIIGSQGILGSQGTQGTIGSQGTQGTIGWLNDVSVNSIYTYTDGSINNLRQYWIDINRFGFVNNADTSISFNPTNYTFTLSAISPTWSYFRLGVKHTIIGSKSITLPGTPPDASTYFIFIDTIDGSLSQSVSNWTLLDTKVPVAIIRYNSTLNPTFQLQEERHTCLIDRRDHFYNHTTRGTQFISGASLDGPTINTPTNQGVTYGVSDTLIADEDLIENLSGLLRPDGSTGTYTIFYRNSPTTWIWVSDASVPYIYAPGGYIYWDNNGTLTEATAGSGVNNRWFNTYLILTSIQGQARFINILGRGSFTSLANAQSEDVRNFDFVGLGIAESIIAWQFTWNTGTGFTNLGKVQLAATPRRINISTITTVGSAASFLHNSLAGLQGGNSSERFHLTQEKHDYINSNTFVLESSIGIPSINTVYWNNGFLESSTGTQGTIGSQGTQGSQGVQGIIGSQGTQGSQGVQGVQGIIGSQGTQGSQGVQGVQGTIGSQGTQGSQGVQGSSTVASGSSTEFQFRNGVTSDFASNSYLTYYNSASDKPYYIAVKTDTRNELGAGVVFYSSSDIESGLSMEYIDDEGVRGDMGIAIKNPNRADYPYYTFWRTGIMDVSRGINIGKEITHSIHSNALGFFGTTSVTKQSGCVGKSLQNYGLVDKPIMCWPNGSPFYMIGKWYIPTVNSTARTTIAQAASATRMTLYPFIPNQTFSIDKLGFEVTTANAGSGRIVIYTTDASMLPSTIFYQTPVDTSFNLGTGTIPLKMEDVSLRFDLGNMYWIGTQIRSTSTAVTLRGIAVSACLSIGIPEASGNTTSATCHYYSTAFGNSAPASPGYGTLTSAIVPEVRFRVKS